MPSKNTSNTASAVSGTSGATAHTSLYRTYRPSDFKEVIGQDHVVSVLEDSVGAGKIAHAYLFCGGRGTGKTSVARIFAKMLGTTDRDLYEIDAASNTSVDDIRNLNESVHTLPFDSKYKVYILDEVHMLSKSAFNAFLKTLEEPPRHVIFILATTELQKLPDTVISRCQTFQFKKPNVGTLKKIAIDIASKEGVKIDEDGANLIALLGDGSFRDTLSVLQKVLSLAGDADSASSKKTNEIEIKLNEIEKITGAPQKTLVHKFIKGLLLGKAEDSFLAIEEVESSALDVKLFTELSMESLRKILLISFNSSNKNELSSLDESLIQEMKLMSVSPKKVANILEMMLTAYSRLGRGAIATLPLELLIAENS